MDKTVQMSVAQSRKVRGYEIKRMPLGAYLTAMETLKDLPGELLSICFPGLAPAEVLTQLAQLDATTLQSVVSRVIVSAPQHIIRAVSLMTDIPEERLLEDPKVGLDGLIEIVDAWIEVNGLANFMSAARTVVAKVRVAIANYSQPLTGSNG